MGLLVVKHLWIYVEFARLKYELWTNSSSLLSGSHHMASDSSSGLLLLSTFSTAQRLWDSTSVGEENETPFVRVWKPLPSRRVLKTLRESLKGKAQRGQYLLAVCLSCYKWYQSQTLGDVLMRRLFSKGGRHEAVCQ